MSTSQKKSFIAPDVTIRPLRESELETIDQMSTSSPIGDRTSASLIL